MKAMSFMQVMCPKCLMIMISIYSEKPDSPSSHPAHLLACGTERCELNGVMFRHPTVELVPLEGERNPKPFSPPTKPHRM